MDNITTKVPADVKEACVRKAVGAGMTLSAYVAKLIADDIEGAQRTDILMGKIMDEVLQLEAMISVMMGVNTEAFSTLLGRSEKEFGSPEEKKKAIDQRKNALAYLNGVISKTVAEVANGENVWGDGN